uniref:Uncharacterized protein n=1 Tax=Pelusios castaneus TaxID=367368 RepID=A0A8C8RYE6_9SAUR
AGQVARTRLWASLPLVARANPCRRRQPRFPSWGASCNRSSLGSRLQPAPPTGGAPFPEPEPAPGRWPQVGDFLWLSDCTQRCICDPSSTFHCVPASCNPGQRCAVKGGKLGCQSQLTTCTVTGDPHYFTFDGAVAHFQGTCAYEISHTCNSSLDFSFRVVAANRNFRNPRVSFIYRVEVWLRTDHFNSHVVLERGKDVLVTQLGHVANITRVKNMVTLRTKVNLEIQFNGRHALFVRVGPEYQKQLCGMCGNFNGDHTDDKILPNGERAQNDAEFGNTWTSDIKIDVCASACPDPSNDTGFTEPCPKFYEVEQACGILMNRTGPFAECHWHESPALYYESCVYDLCQYGQGNQMLCAAVDSYEEICIIHASGDSFSCVLDTTCPATNYFDFCGPACPATCTNLSAPLLCTKPCVAGCFCREGYVLDAGVCVPVSQCGCTLNGQYHQLGEEVIVTDTCRRKCSCRQPTQPMECQDHTCTALEICSIVDGIRGCYPVRFTTLWVFGHSHYTTFDGVAFDYQGVCKYTLSKYCGPAGNLPNFTIKVGNERKSSIVMSWMRLVELDVYGEHIAIAGGQYGHVQVRVNGSLVNLPVVLTSGKLYAYFSGSSVVVQTDFGLSVSYDWSHSVSVSVSETYFGSLCGLGGDFNGNWSDDFRTPNGSVVSDATAFGNSWQDADSPFHCMAVGLPAQCNDVELAQYRSQHYCGVITDTTGPFKECNKSADAQVHLESCVRDLVSGLANLLLLLSFLHFYSSVGRYPWSIPSVFLKTAFFLSELSCPPNSHYELCGPSCPVSCTHPPVPSHCRTPCQEGCQCDPGFVLSGTYCVPREQCGCTHNGRYHLAGESFWEGENCQSLCRCDGSSHTVQCISSTCAPGQFCGIRKGIYGCHEQTNSVCWVSGLSHYTTFDGKRFDFQGTCRYVFAELCEASGSSPFFRVEVKNQNVPRVPMAVTSDIAGVTVTLPVNVKTLGVAIYQHGLYAVLQTPFGLSVSYDLAHSLFVTLPPEYRGQTCGLCGNFNGATDDDFMMRDGSHGKDAFHFAVDWKSEDVPGCDDGCSDSCPGCEEQESLVESKSRCWVIQNPDGPFSSCHSQIDPEPYLSDCIFDLCVSGGESSALCESIQTYAAACQRANVTISPWRNESFCDPGCPANSDYELCKPPCYDSCAHSLIQAHCSSLCAEGCFCNNGYLHSGASCVPEKQCGCVSKGLHYPVGDRVWLSGCHERCSCDDHFNFHCVPASCNPGQQCAVKGGKLGCQSQLTTCTVTGDPHYFTFDGAVAHFQGTCAYEISHTCNSSLDFSFRVVAANSPLLFQVNGRKVNLPHTLGPLGSVSRIKNLVTIQTPANVEIQFNGHHTLFVRVGPEYRKQLCGMCGNFNDNHRDDKVMPSGARAQNDIMASEFCRTLTSQSGPFAECHWHVDPAPFYSSCLYDMCHYGTANGMLCTAIASYEELCSLQEIHVGSWRLAAQCRKHRSYLQVWGVSAVLGKSCEALALLRLTLLLERPPYQLTCGGDHSSVSLSRCLLFTDGFPSEALHLADPSCTGTLIGERLVFYFNNLTLTTSSVSVPPQVNATHAMYSNQVQGQVGNTYGGVISRDRLLFLHFSCAHLLTLPLSSVLTFFDSVVNTTLPSGQWSYLTTMVLYQDPQYSKPFIQSPVPLTVNQRIYVGISISGVDPSHFVLTLSSCWATPDRDPSSSIRWDLIISQCPSVHDGTVTIEEDGVSTTGRFSFSVFQFIPDLELAYLHCRIRLCIPQAATCTAVSTQVDEPSLARTWYLCSATGETQARTLFRAERDSGNPLSPACGGNSSCQVRVW